MKRAWFQKANSLSHYLTRCLNFVLVQNALFFNKKKKREKKNNKWRMLLRPVLFFILAKWAWAMQRIGRYSILLEHAHALKLTDASAAATSSREFEIYFEKQIYLLRTNVSRKKEQMYCITQPLQNESEPGNIVQKRRMFAATNLLCNDFFFTATFSHLFLHWLLTFLPILQTFMKLFNQYFLCKTEGQSSTTGVTIHTINIIRLLSYLVY